MIRMSAWILVAVLAIAGWPSAGADEPLTPAAESPVRLAQEAPAQPGIMRPDLKALAISVVPDLRGQTVAEARDSLEKSGLKLGEVGRVTAQQEPGTVARQSPRAKETTTRGSAVNVWIAEAAQVKVPKLTGLSPKQAETALARYDPEWRFVVSEVASGPHLTPHVPLPHASTLAEVNRADRIGLIEDREDHVIAADVTFCQLSL